MKFPLRERPKILFRFSDDGGWTEGYLTDRILKTGEKYSEFIKVRSRFGEYDLWGVYSKWYQVGKEIFYIEANWEEGEEADWGK